MSEGLFHKEKKRKETILLLCPEIFNINKSAYPKSIIGYPELHRVEEEKGYKIILSQSPNF